MLVTGNQNTGENGMGFCSILGTVAAIGFAGDDCRSQHTLGQVVGSFQVIDIQEAQEMRSMLAQTLGKAGVVAIGETTPGVDQEIQASFERANPAREGARGQGFGGLSEHHTVVESLPFRPGG